MVRQPEFGFGVAVKNFLFREDSINSGLGPEDRTFADIEGVTTAFTRLLFH
jgi:hypothetical protein